MGAWLNFGFGLKGGVGVGVGLGEFCWAAPNLTQSLFLHQKKEWVPSYMVSDIIATIASFAAITYHNARHKFSYILRLASNIQFGEIGPTPPCSPRPRKTNQSSRPGELFHVSVWRWNDDWGDLIITQSFCIFNLNRFLKIPLEYLKPPKTKINSRPTHIPGSSFDRLFGAPPPRPTRPQQLTLVRAFWKLKSGFNLTQKIEFKRSCGFQFDEAEIWLYSNLCGATWYQEIATIHFRQKIDKSFSWCKTHAILKMKLCSKSWMWSWVRLHYSSKRRH